MTKPPKKSEIKDEPGAEERFLKGVKKALATPPKPFTPKKAPASKGKGGRAKK